MNLRPFQIVLLGSFAVLALVSLGAVMFCSQLGICVDKKGTPVQNVVIWGTLNDKAMGLALEAITKDDKEFQSVRYIQKDPRTFDNELLTAIAESRSPDLIILPHDRLVMHRAKLVAISYETIPERDFKDSFIDAAEIFMLSDGVYGVPIAVDPLVMYWNKDIFSSNGLAAPPSTWESLAFNATPAITRINADRTISQSAVALGEYSNVKYAKEILSMLMMQSGSTIINETSRGYDVVLNKASGDGLAPADAAISYYTQFAIPSQQNYTWSRSLPQDRLQFLGGQLGMYFGLGSELTTIERENPNLNFDIARVPQGAGATTLRNYGIIYAFAIPRASKNVSGAYQVAERIASNNYSNIFASAAGLAPVRRSQIEAGTSDSYERVLFQSALISRGWLDPNPTESGQVFRQLIEDITSGRSRANEAVSDTNSRLRLLFR